ncbi:NUDIX domain-containing protein [Pseudomonas sp. P66]|uniref:NUDIX domain-containing protein n=1 Tax=Pseudomonas arcuscaelestis TaxID=2710591 RepID=A0ABS2C5Q8_9PSED|nr:NUDIX domain-containing protein [Pseudomonas arcuscaelestis]MBM5461208.1 NUDIX domain-containing protein [Pseudomonas arcuscaelestis]
MTAKNRKLKARATIICLRSGKILLVRKKGGRWNFPGGAIEAGESPGEAALREMFEETCIGCAGMVELCSLEVGSVLHYIFTTQVADEDKAIAGHEIAACKWVRQEQLHQILLKPMATALISRRLPALSR